MADTSRQYRARAAADLAAAADASLTHVQDRCTRSAENWSRLAERAERAEAAAATRAHQGGSDLPTPTRSSIFGRGAPEAPNHPGKIIIGLPVMPMSDTTE